MKRRRFLPAILPAREVAAAILPSSGPGGSTTPRASPRPMAAPASTAAARSACSHNDAEVVGERRAVRMPLLRDNEPHVAREWVRAVAGQVLRPRDRLAFNPQVLECNVLGEVGLRVAA